MSKQLRIWPFDLEPKDLLMEKYRSLENMEELCCNMISILDQYDHQLMMSMMKKNDEKEDENQQQQKSLFEGDYKGLRKTFAFHEPSLFESYRRRHYLLHIKNPSRLLALQAELQESSSKWNRCLSLVEYELNRRSQLLRAFNEEIE
jgi:hypothetical protein